MIQTGHVGWIYEGVSCDNLDSEPLTTAARKRKHVSTAVNQGLRWQ